MKMEIDAARLLVWRASWMGRTGQQFENAEGSMSKLKAGEVAVWATERAIQILGGNGYAREFPVERWQPRRQDLHDLRGHVGDPAARDLARDQRRAGALSACRERVPERREAPIGGLAPIGLRATVSRSALTRRPPAWSDAQSGAGDARNGVAPYDHGALDGPSSSGPRQDEIDARCVLRRAFVSMLVLATREPVRRFAAGQASESPPAIRCAYVSVSLPSAARLKSPTRDDVQRARAQDRRATRQPAPAGPAGDLGLQCVLTNRNSRR